MLVLLILLAATGGSFYHTLTKSLPCLNSPFASLTVSYLTSAAVTFILLLVFTGFNGIGESFAMLDYKSVLIGVSLVFIETGFFYMYKYGGQLTVMHLLTSSVQTMIILVCGLMIFNEKLSITNFTGVALSIIGIFLIIKK